MFCDCVAGETKFTTSKQTQINTLKYNCLQDNDYMSESTKHRVLS